MLKKMEFYFQETDKESWGKKKEEKPGSE